jgi:cytoskeletal protein CcmA (bactofilin family)
VPAAVIRINSLSLVGNIVLDMHAEEEMAIFKKTSNEEEPQVLSTPTIGPPQLLQPENVTVIGPTLVFKGELSADEDLVIEGHVEGTIAHHRKRLTVGEKGRVKADIHAKSVIVFGKLVGNIHSEGIVSLANGSDVNGDIFCARIAIEDGARFKGKIDLDNVPKVTCVSREPGHAETIGIQKNLHSAGV